MIKSEHSKNNKQLCLRPLVLALQSAFLSIWSGSASSLPAGGQVVSGKSTIVTPTPHNLEIQQSTNKSIINWQSYNISKPEHVNYRQPNASSISLNRVQGAEPSGIYGKLSANGQVFLINPNGVVFGKTARVEVGGLAASTHDLNDNDFMAGRYTFNKIPGSKDAKVINEGKLGSKPGGYVALIGSDVTNSGQIQTPKGGTALAAAERVSLDLRGDGLVNVQVNLAAAKAKVDHKGIIEAPGGKVYLTAQAKDAALDTVLNVEGVVRATSMSQHNGVIHLDGGDSGVTKVSGQLLATGNQAGQKGGMVQILGKHVDLASTAIADASGKAGGGKVLVGGDFQGKAGTRPAETTKVQQGARIKVDARNKGNGGQTVVWADKDTRFDGHISARGGTKGGDGGNAEVSGKVNLVMKGDADLRAPKGKFGTLLLDPGSVSIQPGNGANTGPNLFDDAFIATQLGKGNLTVSTSTATGGGGESITTQQNTTIVWSAPTTFTLNAGQLISMQPGTTIRNTNAGGAFDAIVMNANQGVVPTTVNYQGLIMNGVTLQTQDGNITLAGRGGTGGGSFDHGVFVFSTPSSITSSGTGNITITGTGGGNSTGRVNRGISIETALTVSANKGNVVIDGTGGLGTDQDNGIAVLQPPSAQTSVNIGSQSGNVRFSGTAQVTGGSEAGIVTRAPGSLTSATGTITVSGSTADQLSNAIDMAGSTFAIGDANTTGNIVLVGDRMNLFTATEQTTGTVSLLNKTSGRSISVGSADGPAALGLSAAELNRITAGRIDIGNNATTGAISVTDAVAPTGTSTLGLHSAAGINENATGSISVGTLVLEGGAASTLNNAGNNVTTLEATLKGPLQYRDVDGVTLSNSLINWGSTASTRIVAGAGLTLRNDTITNTNAGATAFDAIVLQGNQGPVQATGSFTGVVLDGATLQTATGNVSINGRGGAGAGTFNSGINTFPGKTTISTADGNITLVGAGGGVDAGSSNRGIDLEADTTLQTTGRGNISLTGTAGVGTGFNAGISFVQGNIALLTNSGNIDITGNGSNVTGSYGFYMGTPTRIVSTSGPTTITGTSGPNVSGTLFTAGIRNLGDASTIGDITLITDSIGLGTVAVQTKGGVTIAPFTAGRQIGLGGPGSLSSLVLSSDELNRITADTLRIGNATAGSINLGSAIAPTGTSNLALVTGGNVTQGAGATLAETNLAVRAANVTLNAANDVDTLSAITTGNFSFNDINGFGIGSVNGLTGVTVGGTALITALNGSLTLNNAISAGASGDALTLAAKSFVNNTGVGGLSAPAGRWRVFSQDPADDTRDGLAFDFKRYNCVFGGACPAGIPATGNGFLYSVAPVLSATPGTASGVYGDTPNLAGLGFTLNGFIDGDTQASSGINGDATFNTTATAASNISGYNIAYLSGLASSLGYRFQDNTASVGELTINPRALVLTPDAVLRSYGDANPAIGSATGNLGGLVKGDTVTSVSLSSSASVTSNVGQYATTASNAVFGNGLATNYLISYDTNPIGLNITPRPISLIPDQVTRLYGDPNPASGSATVNTGNLVNGDGVSNVFINTPATDTSGIGNYASTGSNALFANGLASNYAITYDTNPNGLIINQRPITVTVTPGQQKFLGQPDPAAFDFGFSSLGAGQQLQGNLSRIPGEAIGTYPIGQGSLNAVNNPNYSITFVGDLFTINDLILPPVLPIPGPVPGQPFIPGPTPEPHPISPDPATPRPGIDSQVLGGLFSNTNFLRDKDKNAKRSIEVDKLISVKDTGILLPNDK